MSLAECSFFTNILTGAFWLGHPSDEFLSHSGFLVSAWAGCFNSFSSLKCLLWPSSIPCTERKTPTGEVSRCPPGPYSLAGRRRSSPHCGSKLTGSGGQSLDHCAASGARPAAHCGHYQAEGAEPPCGDGIQGVFTDDE